jgi:hypothetical protein
LRVALLVMLEPAGTGIALPRAFLRVGGASVARHQLVLALALECQRIICIARSVTSDVMDLKQQAERAGVVFQVVPGIPGLIGQVTINDELIVLADGLLANMADARELLGSGQGVAVQPIEAGLAAGFERVDINRAAAGMLRIPGRLIEGLGELPGDCDAVSALTRIALQAGVPMREVSHTRGAAAQWRIVRDEAEAHSVEDAWISGQLAQWRATTPGGLIARALIAAFGPALLHRGNGGRAVLLAFAGLLALAIGFGWFGASSLAFLAAGAGWIALVTAGLLQDVERAASVKAVSGLGRPDLGAWLHDGVVILLAVWHHPAMPWQSMLDLAFAPFILMGMLRLLPAMFPRGWMPWLEDRAILCLLLAMAAALGLLGGAIPLMAGALVVSGLVLAGGATRLTPD